MNRWLDRIPILVFRQALVLVAAVALAAILVLLGMSWHNASRWVLWVGGSLSLLVVTAWVIGSLKEH